MVTRSKGLFVTGTDTNVGKTWVSTALLEWFKHRGKRVLAMKPVASGCAMRFGRLQNEDALLLQQHASFMVDYELINPYAFEPSIAPHIAADQIGCVIELEVIAQRYRILAQQADLIIVEGFGGWQAPLSHEDGVAELAKRLELPVILVVGLRLGCLNHALLTCEALQRSDCEVLGWVANQVDPGFTCLEENVATLRTKLPMPMLAMVPYNEALDPASVSLVFGQGDGAAELRKLL